MGKKSTNEEQSYTEVEKTYCTLIWIIHRLRQYTLYYSLKLITRNDLLRYLANKPALIGRVSKWQILLSEYAITYVNQSLVKRQALTDQLAENLVGDDDLKE